jgi:hypothetical protein
MSYYLIPFALRKEDSMLPPTVASRATKLGTRLVIEALRNHEIKFIYLGWPLLGSSLLP